MATKTTTYRIDGVNNHGTIYMTLDTIEQAEAIAREICRVTGNRLSLVAHDGNMPRSVATVSRDNEGRVWTDVSAAAGALI